MPIYKYLLSILTTISAIAGAFLAASSALSAGLQGGMLAAGLFTGLFFLYGLSAVYLWRPDKRLLWLLTAGLVLAAGGLAFAGQLLAAGAAVILLAIAHLMSREGSWALTAALVLNLLFAALTMLPHNFMTLPLA